MKEQPFVGIAEFQPCHSCSRNRRECDECFWVKEARRLAAHEEREYEEIETGAHAVVFPPETQFLGEKEIEAIVAGMLRRLLDAAVEIEETDRRRFSVREGKQSVGDYALRTLRVLVSEMPGGSVDRTRDIPEAPRPTMRSVQIEQENRDMGCIPNVEYDRLRRLWCRFRGHASGEWYSYLGNPSVAFPEAGIQIKGVWSYTHCQRCGERMIKWEGPTTGGICSDFRDSRGFCAKDDCPRRSVCLIAALGWPPDWSGVNLIPEGYEIGAYP